MILQIHSIAIARTGCNQCWHSFFDNLIHVFCALHLVFRLSKQRRSQTPLLMYATCLPVSMVTYPPGSRSQAHVLVVSNPIGYDLGNLFSRRHRRRILLLESYFSSSENKFCSMSLYIYVSSVTLASLCVTSLHMHVRVLWAELLCFLWSARDRIDGVSWRLCVLILDKLICKKKKKKYDVVLQTISQLALWVCDAWFLFFLCVIPIRISSRANFSVWPQCMIQIQHTSNIQDCHRKFIGMLRLWVSLRFCAWKLTAFEFFFGRLASFSRACCKMYKRL